MKKLFGFLESLNQSFFDLMGFPTIKLFSDFIEVYFNCSSTVRELDILKITGYDEMRFFACDGCIKFVYTFYKDNEE